MKTSRDLFAGMGLEMGEAELTRAAFLIDLTLLSAKLLVDTLPMEVFLGILGGEVPDNDDPHGATIMQQYERAWSLLWPHYPDLDTGLTVSDLYALSLRSMPAIVAAEMQGAIPPNPSDTLYAKTLEGLTLPPLLVPSTPYEA